MQFDFSSPIAIFRFELRLLFSNQVLLWILNEDFEIQTKGYLQLFGSLGRVSNLFRYSVELSLRIKWGKVTFLIKLAGFSWVRLGWNEVLNGLALCYQYIFLEECKNRWITLWPNEQRKSRTAVVLRKNTEYHLNFQIKWIFHLDWTSEWAKNTKLVFSTFSLFMCAMIKS